MRSQSQSLDSVSSSIVEYESEANNSNIRLTFLETREAEEFDKTKVVSSDSDLVVKGSIGCVDIIGVSVLLPDATDLRAQHPSEAGPVDTLDLLCTCHLFGHWQHTAQLVPRVCVYVSVSVCCVCV